MRVKIHGGTRGSKELCRSCSKAFIRKGTAHGQEVIICQEVFESPQRITFPVVECNEYSDATLPNLSEMNKIAWFITTDRRTGRVGFVTAEKADEAMKNAVHENNPL